MYINHRTGSSEGRGGCSEVEERGLPTDLPEEELGADNAYTTHEHIRRKLSASAATASSEEYELGFGIVVCICASKERLTPRE